MSNLTMPRYFAARRTRRLVGLDQQQPPTDARVAPGVNLRERGFLCQRPVWSRVYPSSAGDGLDDPSFDEGYPPRSGPSSLHTFPVLPLPVGC